MHRQSIYLNALKSRTHLFKLIPQQQPSHETQISKQTQNHFDIMNSVSTSLLQDVLRPSALGPGMDKFGLTSRLAGGSTKTHLSRDSSPTRQTQDDSDDEIIGVVSEVLLVF